MFCASCNDKNTERLDSETRYDGVLRSGLVLIVCQGRMSAADAVRRVTVSSLHTVSSLKCIEIAQKGTVGASNMRPGHKAGETGTQLVVVCDTAALTAAGRAGIAPAEQ